LQFIFFLRQSGPFENRNSFSLAALPLSFLAALPLLEEMIWRPCRFYE